MAKRMVEAKEKINIGLASIGTTVSNRNTKDCTEFYQGRRSAFLSEGAGDEWQASIGCGSRLGVEPL